MDLSFILFNFGEMKNTKLIHYLKFILNDNQSINTYEMIKTIKKNN